MSARRAATRAVSGGELPAAACPRPGSETRGRIRDRRSSVGMSSACGRALHTPGSASSSPQVRPARADSHRPATRRRPCRTSDSAPASPVRCAARQSGCHSVSRTSAFRSSDVAPGGEERCLPRGLRCGSRAANRFRRCTAPQGKVAPRHKASRGLHRNVDHCRRRIAGARLSTSGLLSPSWAGSPSAGSSGRMGT